MRINYKQGGSLFLLALMSFSLSLTHGADEDPYPSIMIPIYPTGHNIITRVNRFNGTKSVTYDVQSKYPANEVLELLQILHKEHAKTIVMVTHDPRAAEYASTVLHMDKGQLTGVPA